MPVFNTNLRDFSADEAGAVTVDWVVLTAAVVILAIGAISTIKVSVDELVLSIAAKL